MISLKKRLHWLARVQGTLAIAACAGVAIFFAWPYRTARADLLSTDRQIAEVNAQLAKNEDAARDLPAIEKEVQRLRDQITRGRRLPTQQELPQFIREITQLSQVDRLEQFRYQPDVQRKQLLVQELPVALTFEGNFSDVATFLRQAEQMSRLTRTRKLQIKAKEGKAGGVLAQVSMNIYFTDGK